MQNIIEVPSYATLTAFGLAAGFTYYFLKTAKNEKEKQTNYLFAGVCLGLLTITRLEGFVLSLGILAGLLWIKEKELCKKLIMGFVSTLPILLFYNLYFFGNAFHLGFLKGDLNKIGFDVTYTILNLFDPHSGILFFSPLIVLGIIGLLFSKNKFLRVLGYGSVLLIILMLFRIPSTCTCTLGDTITIGGEALICQGIEGCRMLVQSDANRYMSVLIPFAVIGLIELLSLLSKKISQKFIP